jgi:hypothetical protein
VGTVAGSHLDRSASSASAAAGPSTVSSVLFLPSAHNSSVAPSDAIVLPVASRQPHEVADSTAMVHMPTTFPSINRLNPPMRAASGSTTVMTLPPHYPQYPTVHSGASLSGHGSVVADVMPTEVLRMMAQTNERMAQANERMSEMQSQLNTLTEKSAQEALHGKAQDLKRDDMLFTINQERVKKGWRTISQLPKDSAGDWLGEREFPDLSSPRFPIVRSSNSLLGHQFSSTGAEAALQSHYNIGSAPLPLVTSSSSSYSVHSSNPPIPPFHYNHYNQSPFTQVLFPHPSPSYSHPSHLSHPLQTSQSLQPPQHYFVRT